MKRLLRTAAIREAKRFGALFLKHLKDVREEKQREA